MVEMTLQDFQNAVKVIARVSVDNEKYFSELDGVAGDADFGTSLAGGFKRIHDDFGILDSTAIGQFLTSVSMVMVRYVGGCSGPIWGTAFMRAGAALRDKQTVTLEEFRTAMDGAIQGMMKRGGAKAGDKTLLDPLIRINEMLGKHVDDDNGKAALAEAVEVAEKTAEEAKSWTAMRGRQSFTGDRSIGTLDPGMVAVMTMLKEIQSSLK
ncbi:MAG: dihydroxyacetone kinase subunit DhaL [Lysobacterales bacterium]